MTWTPTANLRWVKKPRERGGDGYWLEQEHVWEPLHKGWGREGDTKWVRVPVVPIEKAGQCDDPNPEPSLPTRSNPGIADRIRNVVNLALRWRL